MHFQFVSLHFVSLFDVNIKSKNLERLRRVIHILIVKCGQWSKLYSLFDHHRHNYASSSKSFCNLYINLAWFTCVLCGKTEQQRTKFRIQVKVPAVKDSLYAMVLLLQCITITLNKCVYFKVQGRWISISVRISSIYYPRVTINLYYPWLS